MAFFFGGVGVGFSDEFGGFLGEEQVRVFFFLGGRMVVKLMRVVQKM